MNTIETISFILAALIVVESRGNLFSYPMNRMAGHRQLQSNGQQANPYSGFGMHFIPIYIGNPAQLRTLAVSTASDFTAMPCEDCVSCGNRGKNMYNFSKSSGFSVSSCDSCSEGNPCFDNRCMVGKSARDSSAWSGYEVDDFAFHGGGANQEVTLVGTNAAEKYGFPMRFVCQTRSVGFFNTVMDGILGLSPAPTSFLSQLHKAGKLEKPHFSLCFNDVDGAGGSYAGTGTVTFGGFSQALLETEMVYAKKVEGMVYKVNVKKIRLRVGGGRSVFPETNNQVIIDTLTPNSVDSGAIVDSSEAFLTLDKRYEQSFRIAWKEATGEEFSHARLDLTEEQLKAMPTILIELEGDPDSPRELDPNTVPGLTSDYNVLVAVPATHYMEHIVADVRPYRARIHFEGQKGSIFGANVMQGHTIVYEPDKNRIGFAESTRCQAKSGEGRNGEGGTVPVDSTDSGVADAANGTTSIQTSGGAPPTSSTRTGSSAGSSASIGGTDDDVFDSGGTTSPTEASSETSAGEEDSGNGGGCFTATCRSFMAIGYVFMGTALAVVYRVSRPKERVGVNEYQQIHADETAFHSNDDLGAYRRNPWNSDGVGGVLV